MTIGLRTAVVTGVVALAAVCLGLIAPGVVRAERLPTTVFTARDGILTVRSIVADSRGVQSSAAA